MLGDTQWCSPCCCCKVPPEGGFSNGGDFTDKCWSTFGATSLSPLTFESQLEWWAAPFANTGFGSLLYPPFYSTGGFALRCLMWPISASVTTASLRIRATARVTLTRRTPPPSDAWRYGNDCRVYATLQGVGSAVSSASLFARSGSMVRNTREHTGNGTGAGPGSLTDPHAYQYIDYQSYRYAQVGLGYQTPALVGVRQYQDPLWSGRELNFTPMQNIDETFFLYDGKWWMDNNGERIELWSQDLLEEGSFWGFPHFGIAFENRYGHAKVEILDFSVDWQYS